MWFGLCGHLVVLVVVSILVPSLGLHRVLDVLLSLSHLCGLSHYGIRPTADQTLFATTHQRHDRTCIFCSQTVTNASGNEETFVPAEDLSCVCVDAGLLRGDVHSCSGDDLHPSLL